MATAATATIVRALIRGALMRPTGELVRLTLANYGSPAFDARKSGRQMKVVVCALGGDGPPFALPESRFSNRVDITGGERSLYEVAFAAVAAGREVELRGDISRGMFEALRTAVAGAPSVGHPPRRPDADDIVIMPEALDVPAYAGPLLSDARTVMLVLSPLGLCGPVLRPGWTQPDPLTAPVSSVARPELFRALTATGLELWTNSPATAAVARDAGVRCTHLGTGSPLPVPRAQERPFDVALVEHNRWKPHAEAVAERLQANCLRIGERHGWNALIGELAKARILIWPSRLEGNSRIQREARSVGTVPVALPNPFTPDLTEDCGAVTVESLDEMPGAIKTLLAEPERLTELSRRAIAWAHAQSDWNRYIARVDRALAHTPEPEPWMFRQLTGTALDRLLEQRHAELRQIADLTHQVDAERVRASQLDRRRHRLADRLADGLGSTPGIHRLVKVLLSPPRSEDRTQ